ncbi:MAG: exopolysaccharide transport family protein [Sphingobacteriaceae bacterium]
MELSDYFKILSRHKFTLIIIPLITVVLTFFLVRNLPDVYNSQAQIATGIIDQTQPTLNEGSLQESKINQEFSNLIEMMHLKKVVDQVTYQLIIHDLSSKKPFKKPSAKLEALSANERKNALQMYFALYKEREQLDLSDPDQIALNEIITSMKYDEASINKMLLIFRANNSDFITVKFQAENALLSAFAVNTLCSEFISYYNSLVKENQARAVTFLRTLSGQKKIALDEKVAELRSYKIQNRVLNLDEQAKTIYGQIAEFETRQEQAERDIVAYQGALNGIDSKFDPKDRKYIESALVRINQDIINTKVQLRKLNDLYIQNDFDEQYKKQIDVLQSDLASQISQSADKYISNPLAAKQALITQKVALQIQFDLSKFSIQSIKDELARLNIKFDTMVPHEAVVQSMESAIEIAGKEYLEILQRYNQSSLEAEFSVQLRLAEIALPELPQPSKKMLLIILSGIISFVFCLFVFFILFYLDHSVKKPLDLANKTGIPVLGSLQLITGDKLNLAKIWDPGQVTAEMQRLKDQLRAIRFEVDNELKGQKILLVSSMNEQEGKTLFSISLAYAYSMVNKKVLLIDGNFNHPSISETLKPTLFLEDCFREQDIVPDFRPDSAFEVIGNRGGDISILEISDKNLISERLTYLKSLFDVIIVESPALNCLNKAKEWVLIAEKVLAVFEVNKNISEDQQQDIEYLRRQDEKFIGWILNKVSGNAVVKKRRFK